MENVTIDSVDLIGTRTDEAKLSIDNNSINWLMASISL
jgi:hypothetical protein